MSDYLGRANTYIVFFVFQILAYYFLPQIFIEILFLTILFTVITMYGGGFSTLPAFLGGLFGTKQLGVIHGFVFTAWALAGVAGPSIYDYVKKQTGVFNDYFRGFFRNVRNCIYCFGFDEN